MPKVSGSYQGITLQPAYQTYQTAGMLTPSTPPVVPTPQTPPVVTPPPAPPPPPPVDLGGVTGTVHGLTSPTVTTNQTTTLQPVISPVPQERQRLVDAVIRRQVIEE